MDQANPVTKESNDEASTVRRSQFRLASTKQLSMSHTSAAPIQASQKSFNQSSQNPLREFEYMTLPLEILPKPSQPELSPQSSVAVLPKQLSANRTSGDAA